MREVRTLVLFGGGGVIAWEGSSRGCKLQEWVAQTPSTLTDAASSSSFSIHAYGLLGVLFMASGLKKKTLKAGLWMALHDMLRPPGSK